MTGFFNNKPFDEIDFNDIEEFIGQRVPECLTLDYKGDILQSGQLPKAKEFGKDVSAFANTFGGWIIYGIHTDDNDELLPLTDGAIIGIENINSLKESIENKILSSIVPKPLYRIKKISLPDEERCLILVYIPQSYNHVHIVVGRGENRFYKRYEYSSIPMDYNEIKNKFEEIGHTEEYRSTLISKLIDQVSMHIPRISENNLFCLASVPKFLINGRFNDRDLVRRLTDENRELGIIEYGSSIQRRSNRFFNELIFDETERVATLNYYYNGMLIQVRPIDLFIDNRVNASAIYFYIYYFLKIIVAYYNIFDFLSIIDLRFELKGIIGKELAFRTRADRAIFPGTSFTFDEEIDNQILSIDISDLENQIIDISQSFVEPLFYGININATEGICNADGTPLYE